MNKRSLFVLATSLAMVGTPVVLAQPAPGGDGGGRGQRGGGGGGPGGGWDPAQMRERMAQRMKEQLGVTDEEYTVLQPKLEAVQMARFEANAGGGFGGFGGGGRRGGGGGGPGGGGGGPWGEMMQNSPVAKANRELRETLENKDASADAIKVKVEALRKAKAEAKEKLAKAQAELRELLTPRQEAVLVADGTLE